MEVLVTADLPARALAGLSAVDPRLHVVQLTRREREFFAQGNPLASGVPDRLRGSVARRLARAEVLITFPQAPADLSSSVPRLRWLQLLTAGADELPDRELIKRVPVTTVREVRARPVAEYAMLLVLAFAKRLHHSIALQGRGQWSRLEDLQELSGKTIGIIGLGAIGSEIAKMAKAFGMRVLASRRSVREGDSALADELLTPGRLPDLLRASDYVVLAAPSTRETYHLIGKAELQMMRRNAVLINVARGALVDEQALIEALRRREIAGAGLDVFEHEPLPSNSRLYELDNVIISAHSAGMTDRFLEAALPILTDNLQRFLAGQPLRNRVDPGRDY